jgi:hypothetical protein
MRDDDQSLIDTLDEVIREYESRVYPSTRELSLAYKNDAYYRRLASLKRLRARFIHLQKCEDERLSERLLPSSLVVLHRALKGKPLTAKNVASLTEQDIKLQANAGVRVLQNVRMWLKQHGEQLSSGN